MCVCRCVCMRVHACSFQVPLPSGEKIQIFQKHHDPYIMKCLLYVRMNATSI